jgi:hypothetical protein
LLTGYLGEVAPIAEFIEIYQRALAIRERVLGASHPDTGLARQPMGPTTLSARWTTAAVAGEPKQEGAALVPGAAVWMSWGWISPRTVRVDERKRVGRCLFLVDNLFDMHGGFVLNFPIERCDIFRKGTQHRLQWPILCQERSSLEFSTPIFLSKQEFEGHAEAFEFLFFMHFPWLLLH